MDSIWKLRCPAKTLNSIPQSHGSKILSITLPIRHLYRGNYSVIPRNIPSGAFNSCSVTCSWNLGDPNSRTMVNDLLRQSFLFESCYHHKPASNRRPFPKYAGHLCPILEMHSSWNEFTSFIGLSVICSSGA